MRFLLLSLLALGLCCCPPSGSDQSNPIRDFLNAIFGGGNIDPDTLPPGINPSEPAGEPVPEIGESVSLVVISQASVDAGVLIRFFVNDVEVRRTVFLVPAGKTMNPVGPDRATRILVTGSYIGDGPTPNAQFLLGTDFTEGDVLQYIIPEPPDECPDDPAKVFPGQCGCGVPDTDTDHDGSADCHDGCPQDAGKTAPGLCGCGVADADGDGDGTPDCNDLCPADPGKTLPGLCGCGIPDTDRDGDGVPDCIDGCPSDPAKTAVGACGCGVPDTDSDGDGTPNCHDGCPLDPGKTAPGLCGCGVADTDSDTDGTPDCRDTCPHDPLKTSPGICDCGTADTDTDEDGTADCQDGCPADKNKTSPGVCDCGTSDKDSDGDGTADCKDGCPNDPLKISPGVCDCGVADSDLNGNGTPDCNDPAIVDTDNDTIPDESDNCPTTPNTDQADQDHDGLGDVCDGCPTDADKTAPGLCGCGVADTDTDEDGTPDCNDLCPADPGKALPGLCGCGVPDVDSDRDGALDCQDGCPEDAGKTAAGLCGCGVADTDSDEDGTPDCHDLCPLDDGKTEQGVCGCGIPDDDSDEDGVPDCIDGCPHNSAKIDPGVCGCEQLDADSDEDGILDCLDGCPFDPANDGDQDGVCGDVDQCPNTIPNLPVNAVGCPLYPVRVDADRDGDVDLSDFGAIQACWGGPGVPVAPECWIFLLDGDEDVDNVDLALFLRCYSGADVAADPACRDCNSNETDDRDDLLACDGDVACADCNGNGLPDSCDLAENTSVDADQNGIPDECDNPIPGTRRYVDAFSEGGDGRSWWTAYRSLQDALTEAAQSPGSVDEIWVAQGVYLPTAQGDRLASFVLVNGVGVYGGFEGLNSLLYPGGETSIDQRNPAAHPTTLSGDIGEPGDVTDNSYHVVLAVNVDSSAVLDGFTIRDGFADGTFENSIGAGMLFLAGNVRVNNCIIQSNYASYGAGLYSAAGSPSVVNCAFALNHAQAEDGAGGAVYAYKGRPTFTNCTFAGNDASFVAGGVYFYQVSLATITNCILWDNDAGQDSYQDRQIAAVQGSVLAVNYTCVQGWTGALGGVGNIGFNLSAHDPRFVRSPDALTDDAGDLGLDTGSPCVDAGNNGADTDAATAGLQPLPPLDLGWLPRFVDDPYPDTGLGTPPIIDMGAYERQPAPPVVDTLVPSGR